MIYKNILVAVDESTTSKLAIKEAKKFAKASSKVFLRFLHVGNEFFIDWDGKAIYPKDTQEVFENAQLALLQNIEIELHQEQISNFETRLLEATPHARLPEQIVSEAKSWPADLIIIGTHGRQGFHHFMLGSVAEGVIRIAPMPVLLVRGS
ncbi:MAG: universal stress protein [Proteobacteria bacterium]|nr:universal stress protein [Pseudomonadota bacterium]